MADLSFYWHDYETFGRVPRRDRPSQFAGVRTDADLNEIDAPLMVYCQPAPDYLPEPEACLLTGITPQTLPARGPARAPVRRHHRTPAGRPGTIGVGYNSIRFDDEVTRHLFWRNLIDPYAREWQNECGRWDLLDVVRTTWALRPEGIEWPRHEDGRPSFKLEHLAAANGLMHEAAHDALSDVRATISLARLIKTRQPRLWDFCLRCAASTRWCGRSAWASRSCTSRACTASSVGGIAPVWPLAPHPTNKNEVIVWDLMFDPSELFTLGVEEIRTRMFTRTDELPEGVTRLPFKTTAHQQVADRDRQPQDPERRAGGAVGPGHGAGAAPCRSWPRKGRTSWRACGRRCSSGRRARGGRRRRGPLRRIRRQRGPAHLQSLRTLDAPGVAAKRPVVRRSTRLQELWFRYRARNFPQTLGEPEQHQWREHCAHRLHDGAGGALTLEAFFERVDALGEEADERGQALLGELVDYATEIAPERG